MARVLAALLPCLATCHLPAPAPRLVSHFSHQLPGRSMMSVTRSSLKVYKLNRCTLYFHSQRKNGLEEMGDGAFPQVRLQVNICPMDHKILLVETSSYSQLY